MNFKFASIAIAISISLVSCAPPSGNQPTAPLVTPSANTSANPAPTSQSESLTLTIKGDTALQAFSTQQAQEICLPELKSLATQLTLPAPLSPVASAQLQAKGVRVNGNILSFDSQVANVQALIDGIEIALPAIPQGSIQAVTQLNNAVGNTMGSISYTIQLSGSANVTLNLKPAKAENSGSNCTALIPEISGGSLKATAGGLLVDMTPNTANPPTNNPAPNTGSSQSNVASIKLNVDNRFLTEKGQTRQLSASLFDASGNELPAGTGVIQWTSSRPNDISVDTNGMVKALVGLGFSQITVAVAGTSLSDQIVFDVTDPSFFSSSSTSSTLTPTPVPVPTPAFRYTAQGVVAGRQDKSLNTLPQTTLPAENFYLNGQVMHLVTDSDNNLYFIKRNYNGDDFVNVIYKMTPTGDISHIAGNPEATTPITDGANAKTTAIIGDYQIAAASNEDIYLSSSGDHRVYKVSNGQITFFAGTGTAGSNGDNGQATAAQINQPDAVAVDSTGVVYVMERGGQLKIRRIGLDGVITTIHTNVSIRPDAGMGIANDILYFVQNNQLTSYDPDTEIVSPEAISLNSQFVINAAADRVTWVETRDVTFGKVRTALINDANSTTVIAGNDSIAFTPDTGGVALNLSLDPYGIAADNLGNIYLGNRTFERIHKINNGNISTLLGTYVGDGNVPAQVILNDPAGVHVDSSGNVFIADKNNQLIRKVSSAGVTSTLAGFVRSRAGGGTTENLPLVTGAPAIGAALLNVATVIPDSQGNLIIAETNQIRKIDAATGNISLLTSATDNQTDNGNPAINVSVRVSRLTLDKDNNIYFTGENKVRKIDAVTGVMSVIAGTGSSGFTGDNGPAKDAELDSPNGVAVDLQGNILVSDQDNHRIRKIDLTTGIITTIAGGEEGFAGDGGPAVNAQFNEPTGIIVDKRGDIFISDNENHRVRRIEARTGIITTVAGNGTEGFNGLTGKATDISLDDPEGLFMDANDILYIADNDNDIIRKLSVNF